ncbi:MAG: proton-conducting transporter membrane subunit, partial [Desulfobacterales bacterium]
MAPTVHAAPAPGYSRIGLFSAALPLLLFAALCLGWPQIVKGAVLSVQWPWVPSLEIGLQFRLDGLSLLFGLIVTGSGVLVVLFASSYMAGHPQAGRFFAYLHAFMLAMLGIVMADNLLLMFIFWEITTLISYLLIGFDHESGTARGHARQALLVSAAGGLALLVGILLLKIAGGSLIPSQWMEADQQIRQHPLYAAILITILLGAMT